MGCLSKGLLRAYLDDELDVAEREGVEHHLARCARCERAARLAATAAEGVRSRLGAVAPVIEPDVERTLTRTRSLMRQGATKTRAEGSLAMRIKNAWRPALAGGLVLLLLVSILSFGPGQALARHVLSVFRVRRFAVVPITTAPGQIEEVARQLQETLFVAEDPVLIQEPTRTTVATIEEASAAAGFEVRMPAHWPGGDAPRITVVGPSEQVLRFRGDGLRLLLELAQMDPSAVPVELVEDEVRVTSRSAVYIEGSNISIAQVADIVATYPEGIDVAIMVEAGLRVLGVEPREAHRLSQEYDWSYTALIPVLSNAMEVRQTEIAGAEALLVRTVEPQEPHWQHTTLLMERDGILYIVAVQASFERLVQIAQSMF